MPTWAILTVVFLLSFIIIGQVIFVILLLRKVHKEKGSLIELHTEHIHIIQEQRDAYKDLVDDLIEQKIIKLDDSGEGIADWCRLCARQTIKTSEGTFVKCKECPHDKD